MIVQQLVYRKVCMIYVLVCVLADIKHINSCQVRELVHSGAVL